MLYTLLVALLAFLAPLGAETLQEIDQELVVLQEQLHQLRKEEFNTEISSQADFRENSAAYAKKLAEAEKKDQAAMKIVRKIAELQTKKQAQAKPKPQ